MKFSGISRPGTLAFALAALLWPGSVGAISSRTAIAPTGSAVFDYFGRSVSAVGDVNGDGHPDVVVGAYGNDTGGMMAGAAYVYFGGPGADGAADLTLIGEQSYSYFGLTVASAGDMNGDGFPDIAVSAPLIVVGDDYVGRVYIYNGGPGMDATPDLVITGPVPSLYGFSESFGSSIAGGSDVDADGYADLIVGSPAPEGDDVHVPGRAFVYFGGPSADSVPDLVLTGEAEWDEFGTAVAPVGDFNGDGYADLAVGAPGNDAAGEDAGRVYLYLGGPTLDNLPDFILSGEAAGSAFGASVARAGDVNGDGHTDLIAGARTNSAGGQAAGRAYVYFGGSAGDAVADLVMTGEAPWDNFGGSVSSAGDANADGYADLIVGANGNDAAGDRAGRAYVYFGGPSADAVQDVVLTGQIHDSFGSSVASAGDFDGDGHADVIVGATQDVFGAAPGKAVVTLIYPYQVISPNGGEHWALGEQDTVRWYGHDVADLLLSRNGGSTWVPIASAIGGLEQNEYVFTTSGAATLSAKVALTYSGQTVAPHLSDWSDSIFTIGNSYTITATAGPHGSITPSGSVIVAAGSNQLFRALPDANYHVADLVVDGVSLGALSTYTFRNVQQTHTIHAMFAINSYTLTVNVWPRFEAGSVSLSPPGGTYEYGTVVTLTAIPATELRYEFLGWSATDAANPKVVVVDKTDVITAGFGRNPHVVKVLWDAPEGGTVTWSPGLPRCGEDAQVRLTAIPEAGWTFRGWCGDYSSELYTVYFYPSKDMTVVGIFTESGAPSVQVTKPLPGAWAAIGSSIPIEWTASDPDGIASVDLYLSRAGAAGPWEPIATGLPNSGSYNWTVSGPPTHGNAYVKAVAHNPPTPGQSGWDITNTSFNIEFVTGVAESEVPPGALSLRLASTNPAGSEARFELALPREAKVTMDIVDVQGRRVARLADGKYPGGRHVLAWSGRHGGGVVPSGVYFYRLAADGEVLRGRFVLVR